MNKVYIVGTMHMELEEIALGKFPSERKTRVWAFFAHFEDAEKYVLQNSNNIFEYYYNLALIEEHYVYDPNDPPDTSVNIFFAKQWWYRADHSDDKLEVTITPMECPQAFSHVVNWWGG